MSLTGNPCPFCGITTDISSINSFLHTNQNSFGIKNSLSIAIYIVAVAQIVLRTFTITKFKKINRMERIIKADITTHIFLLSWFVAWSVKRFFEVSI